MEEPGFPIEENLRSQSSKDFKGDAEMWNYQDDLAEFRPERWLKANAKGELNFDSRAAPLQTFGLGVRSCYGKKLAYLEMRVIYALIVWNFELLPIPDSLSDWKAQDVLTHQVQNSRIRLAKIKT